MIQPQSVSAALPNLFSCKSNKMKIEYPTRSGFSTVQNQESIVDVFQHHSKNESSACPEHRPDGEARSRLIGG